MWQVLMRCVKSLKKLCNFYAIQDVTTGWERVFHVERYLLDLLEPARHCWPKLLHVKPVFLSSARVHRNLLRCSWVSEPVECAIFSARRVKLPLVSSSWMNLMRLAANALCALLAMTNETRRSTSSS